MKSKLATAVWALSGATACAVESNVQPGVALTVRSSLSM